MSSLIKNRSQTSNFLEGFWDTDRLEDLAFRSSRSGAPAVNIVENDDKFIIEVGAPGFNKENYNVSLNGDSMTISGKRNKESQSNEEKYTRREFDYAEFNRTFRLPDSVDTEQVSARCEDGILAISIPKKSEDSIKQARVIKVD